MRNVVAILINIINTFNYLKWALKNAGLHSSRFRLFTLLKDTISADEEHDKIEADDNTQLAYSSVSLYAVVHHRVPIFSGQDLDGLKSMRNECTLLIKKSVHLEGWLQNINDEVYCAINYERK